MNLRKSTSTARVAPASKPVLPSSECGPPTSGSAVLVGNVSIDWLMTAVNGRWFAVNGLASYGYAPGEALLVLCADPEDVARRWREAGGKAFTKF